MPLAALHLPQSAPQSPSKKLRRSSFATKSFLIFLLTYPTLAINWNARLHSSARLASPLRRDEVTTSLSNEAGVVCWTFRDSSEARAKLPKNISPLPENLRSSPAFHTFQPRNQPADVQNSTRTCYNFPLPIMRRFSLSLHFEREKCLPSFSMRQSKMLTTKRR